MDNFNKVAMLNSTIAFITSLLSFGGILTIAILYFKFLTSLKSDIRDAIEHAINKSKTSPPNIDKKAIQDAIIKKFMK